MMRMQRIAVDSYQSFVVVRPSDRRSSISSSIHLVVLSRSKEIHQQSFICSISSFTNMSAACSSTSLPCSPSSSSSAIRQHRIGSRMRKVREMKDSTALFIAGRFDLIRDRLRRYGFVLIRGVISRDRVAAARRAMIDQLRAGGNIMVGGGGDAMMKTGNKTGKPSETLSWICAVELLQRFFAVVGCLLLRC